MAEGLAGDFPVMNPEKLTHKRVGSSAADLEIVRVMSASLRSMPSEGITEVFKEIFEGSDMHGEDGEQWRQSRISENRGADGDSSDRSIEPNGHAESSIEEEDLVNTISEAGLAATLESGHPQDNLGSLGDLEARISGAEDESPAEVGLLSDVSSAVAGEQNSVSPTKDIPEGVEEKLVESDIDGTIPFDHGGLDKIDRTKEAQQDDEDLGDPDDDDNEDAPDLSKRPGTSTLRSSSMPLENLTRLRTPPSNNVVKSVSSFRVTSLTTDIGLKGLEQSMKRFSDEEIMGAGATVSVAYGQTIVRAKVNPRFIRRRYSTVYHPDSIIHGIKAHDEFFWAPDSDTLSFANSDESISRDASSHDHHSEAKAFALMALSNMNIDSTTGEALPSWQVAKSVRPRSRSGSMQWVSKEFEEKLREFNETLNDTHTGSVGDPTELDHSEKEFDADATDDVMSEKSRGSKRKGRVNRVMQLSKAGRHGSRESIAETTFTVETLDSPRPVRKHLTKARGGNGGSPMRPPPKSKSAEPPQVVPVPKKIRRRSIERLHQGNNIRCFRYHNVLQNMSGPVKASPRDVLESEKVKYNGHVRSPIRDLPKDVLGDYDAKAEEEKADNPSNVWKGVDIMRDTPSAILAFMKNKFPTKEDLATKARKNNVSKEKSKRKKGVSPQPSVFVQDSISALNGVYKKSYPRSVNLVEAKTKNKILGVNFRKKFPVLPPIPPEINIGHLAGPAPEREDSISSLADFLANAEGRALDSIPDKGASSASTTSGKVKFTGDNKARLRELGFTPPSGNPGLFGLSELTGSDNEPSDGEQYEESEFENETPNQSQGGVEKVAAEESDTSDDDGLVIYKETTSYPSPNPNPCPFEEASFDSSRDVTLLF